VTSLADVIIWLSIAYALLGVLLLVICIFARIPWPVKAGVIVLTSTFYLVSFFATRSLLGWSSIDPLPPKFKLLGGHRHVNELGVGKGLNADHVDFP